MPMLFRAQPHSRSDRATLHLRTAGTDRCASRIPEMALHLILHAVSVCAHQFFIGSHTGGQLTLDWSLPKSGTPVIQLDIDPVELGRNYPNAVSLAGDARAVLQQLIDAATPRPDAAVRGWTSHVEDLVMAWREEFKPLLDSDAMPIRLERICKEISAVLPPNGVVVSDTGHSGMWTGAMIEMNHPGQRYVRCAGSMGWGFPGAMGVKCALPDQTVICFTGDGAFYYHIAELETAARFNINLVVVVNNNTALNQEIPLWDNAYPGKSAAHARTEDLWRFCKIDFAKVAESFGCIGIRVDDPRELNAALKQAIGLKRPVVIDVISDVNAYAPKGWTPEGGKGAY